MVLPAASSVRLLVVEDDRSRPRLAVPRGRQPGRPAGPPRPPAGARPDDARAAAATRRPTPHDPEDRHGAPPEPGRVEMETFAAALTGRDTNEGVAVGRAAGGS